MISTSPKMTCILYMVKIKSFLQKKSFKFFPKVRNILNKEISLITVKDHVKNTLNLAMATQDGVLEMRLNSQKNSSSRQSPFT